MITQVTCRYRNRLEVLALLMLFATTAGNVKFEFASKSKKRVRVIPAETVEAAKTA